MLRANDDCWCGSGKKYKRCHQADAAAPAAAVGPERVGARRDRASRLRRRPAPGAHHRVDGQVARRHRADARARAGSRATCSSETGAAVAPGVTTDELDRVAHEAHITRGVYPSPLGYRGFPKSVCTSVNEVICHGIPDDRALADGDIVNVDVTVYVDGVHGDTNATFCVGRRRPGVEAPGAGHRASASTSAIEAVRPGAPLSDIGRAIETHAHAAGFFVVRAFVGHGIGEVFHGPPQVPHYYERVAAHRPRAGHGVHHRAHDHDGQHRSR